MIRTDDPIMDFYRHEDEAEAWLRSRPVCAICGEYIQDEYAVHIDGAWICMNCIEEKKERIE